MNNQFSYLHNSYNQKPTLLFHACCGVCCVYPLLLLDKYFDITIYYTNSNIQPISEYDHRLSELERYLRIIEKHNIKLVVAPRQSDFITKLAPYHKEKEGGFRCKICYDLRLEESFQYAQQEHYDYCASVMSISPHKNADIINQIGEELAQKYDVQYLPTNLKKNNGSLHNTKLNKLLDLYHQNYCGCPFSFNFPKSKRALS